MHELPNQPIAKELVAQMQLKLHHTAGRLLSRMRFVEQVAPRFEQSGILQKYVPIEELHLSVSGVATEERYIQAFGGWLYGCVLSRQDFVFKGREIIGNYQDSRVDINEIDGVDLENRIKWKRYHLLYDVLEEMFSRPQIPDLILVDLPLVIGRELIPRSDDPDVTEEYKDLTKRIREFWGKNLKKCYPHNEYGPRIVYFGNRQIGLILKALKRDGEKASPDQIDPAMQNWLNDQWFVLKGLGFERFIKSLMKPNTRTAAYSLRAVSQDNRVIPEEIYELGMLGFHLRCGIRTPVYQVETLGSPENWNTSDLNRLAAEIGFLTLYDNEKALPVPIWYARSKVAVIKKGRKRGLLEWYRSQTLRLIQNEEIIQDWLDDFSDFAGS